MTVAKSTAAARLINRYDVMLLNPAKTSGAEASLSTPLCAVADIGGRAGGNRRVTDGRRAVVSSLGHRAKVNRALRPSERRLSIVTMRIG